jgi:hypothetical protein
MNSLGDDKLWPLGRNKETEARAPMEPSLEALASQVEST